MWKAIDGLDFERIRTKLLHRRKSEWTPQTVLQAERGYRQFLKLSAKYPDVAVVPDEAVDAFWHAHILDTRRYAADCRRIFGHMLHHNPYVGIDGAEDEANLRRLADVSNELAVREFGSTDTCTPAYCAVAADRRARPAYCAVSLGERANPAYCAIAASTSAQPAYCAVTTTRHASAHGSRLSGRAECA
jgi:hypothetical protein